MKYLLALIMLASFSGCVVKEDVHEHPYHHHHHECVEEVVVK